MGTIKGTRGTLRFTQADDGTLRVISGMPTPPRSRRYRLRRRLIAALKRIVGA